MAVAPSLPLTKAYQAKPRHFHCTASSGVGGRCFVFAGQTADKTKEELSSHIEVFDAYLERWTSLKTTGSPPKGLRGGGGCCVSSSGDLLVYGGWDGSTCRGGLYKLSSLEWIQLSVESDANGPMKKRGCGLVCFMKNKVAVIGGYGLPHGPPQPGSTFVKHCGERGSTNEVHIFDLHECIWSSPTVSGSRPPPGGGFTLTSIDEHRAILHGGYDAKRGCRSSDLYLIDFQTMVFTELIRKGEQQLWPVGRSSHTACCLGFGSEHPHLLMIGGHCGDYKGLKDCWLFDVSRRRWKEVGRYDMCPPEERDQLILSPYHPLQLPLPDCFPPRYGHSITAVELAPGLIEVTVFGGISQLDASNSKSLDHQTMVAETIIMSFESMKSSEGVVEWQLVGVANSSQPGSDERVRGRIEKMKQFFREASKDTASHLVSPDDRDDKVQRLIQALQQRDVEADMREREVQQQLGEAKSEREQAQLQTMEADRRRKDAERQLEKREREFQQLVEEANSEREYVQQHLEAAEKRKEESERQYQIREEELRQQLAEAERLRGEAERQVRVSRRRAIEAEAEARELATQWVVRRDEIQLTDVELGRGGWGAVVVANFRGIQVAAKCFYRELTSNYYRDMFSREMNMAARLRHPNLVQFIGASVEGIPVILTELMKTSLRSELEKGSIKLAQVTSISMDVAKALNYLHLMKPHPIIHRDISSANVLLDPLPDNCWKAKVSDYGSVNLQQQLHTENPGSPVYSSPEANNPALQSPKMDIFSFGVLLVEMLTGRFPQVSSRQRLIGSIDHAGYLALIEQCLSEERDQRPSAQEIVAILCEI